MTVTGMLGVLTLRRRTCAVVWTGITEMEQRAQVKSHKRTNSYINVLPSILLW